MISQWLGTSWLQAGLVVLSTLGAYLAVIVVIRLNGIRSFSKMSSFDFATTVATGSLVATVAVSSSSLANGAIALVTMYAAQKAIAHGRTHALVAGLVDNRPVLLVAHGRFVRDGLAIANITEHDVVAKLREHGVDRLANVTAAVVETTGEISVLHGAGTAPEVDPQLYEGVRLADRLET